MKVFRVCSRELAFFFPEFVVPETKRKKSAKKVQRTLALIRPDALRERKGQWHGQRMHEWFIFILFFWSNMGTSLLPRSCGHIRGVGLGEGENAFMELAAKKFWGHIREGSQCGELPLRSPSVIIIVCMTEICMQCHRHTVKHVYKDHPRDQQNVVFIHRCTQVCRFNNMESIPLGTCKMCFL